MKIACLCPTYKRPDCLRNVVSCFIEQAFRPCDESRLFVLDDAGQYQGGEFEFCQFEGKRQIFVRSVNEKFPTLPGKFNALAQWAIEVWPEVEAFAVWEDDDVYLPSFLAFHAYTLEKHSVSMPSLAYGNYNRPKGVVQVESAEGRFHGSWAFTRELFEKVGGWIDTPDLMFDQWFGARLKQEGRRGDPSKLGLTYVYRWGNGIYHGSQFGNTGFSDQVEALNIPSPFQGHLRPSMDQETRILMDKWERGVLGSKMGDVS